MINVILYENFIVSLEYFKKFKIKKIKNLKIFISFFILRKQNYTQKVFFFVENIKNLKRRVFFFNLQINQAFIMNINLKKALQFFIILKL